MNLLSPDKSNMMLKKYHLSNHLLIPGLAISYGLSKYDTENKYTILQNTVNFANVFNLGYHSYFSTSTIISDYIKPRFISQIARSGNVGLHALAICGLCKILKK